VFFYYTIYVLYITLTFLFLSYLISIINPYFIINHYFLNDINIILYNVIVKQKYKKQNHEITRINTIYATKLRNFEVTINDNL